MKQLVLSPIILNTFVRRSSSALAIMVAFLGSTSAFASGAVGTYPKLLQDAAEADDPPVGACKVCHASGSGPTMGTPLGDAIKAAGLKSDAAMTVEKMKTYLDKLNDSDKGGTDDVDELKAGTDPNDDGDDDSAAGSSGAGGGGGTGTSGRGNSGSGNTNGSSGGDDDDSGAQGSATSAGCSVGVLDSSTGAGTLALMVGAGLFASASRKRKRR